MPALTLRTKFILSLALITALITAAVLLIVRYRVQLQVRNDLTQALDTSVVTFGRLQQQREVTLERSAALLAALPPLKALMTSGDDATIQDASQTFWELAGSQVFVLASRNGRISAFHTSASAFSAAAAQTAIDRYLAGGSTRDWWFGGGHLFQVFLQPISFGPPESGYPIGLLAVGYEIDRIVAEDVKHVAASEVGFAHEGQLVVSTVSALLEPALESLVADAGQSMGAPLRVQLGAEAYLANTVLLSDDSAPPVTLTVLKSFDEATAFLQTLNRWILAIGAAGVLVGSGLVFLVSTTFTRPLGRLVSGVKALEKGDYGYPLNPGKGDEVAALTAAFDGMRRQLLMTQRQLLEAERMATIGRMANTISHDLRHPLTAIQAYAEFLAERELTDGQRKDYCQEIRIAVNHMIDQINTLLGFSHERQALVRTDERLDVIIDRAIRTVKALPDYEALTIAGDVSPACSGWIDAGKFERVILNLLFNAAEAVATDGGRIHITAATGTRGVEVRVTDNGPGIPDAIRDSLFEPFVSHGKQRGTGLGLTVVHNVMQQHGGDVVLEHTGPDGTTFLLRFPPKPPPDAGA
ncbi:MAG: HAMP domain-containing histidine kinase [Acidobacteria bacterium]|nr:HAMP domain-containing histidine kinase [Acidobacteriota bacterium]